MSHNNVHKTTQPKVVLFDLDDNLHEAERHLFLPGWRHVLAGFGYMWRPDGSEQELGLKPITKEQEPGVGVMPKKVARHFVKQLGLSVFDYDEIRLRSASFKHIKELNELHDHAVSGVLSLNEVNEAFADILEGERVSHFLQRIEEVGIDGYPDSDVVRRLHESGYKVGIVTSANYIIATAVLEKLGLIEYETEQTPKGERRVIKSRYVDAIVSGHMAEEPKPSAAPLRMADWVIRWNSLPVDVREEYKLQIASEKEKIATDGVPLNTSQKRELLGFSQDLLLNENDRALFHAGDSGSDVRAGVAYGIPVIVRGNEFSDPQKLRDLGATIIVDSYASITPEMLTLPPTQWEGSLRAKELK